jgi:hypothetical protein
MKWITRKPPQNRPHRRSETRKEGYYRQNDEGRGIYDDAANGGTGRR